VLTFEKVIQLLFDFSAKLFIIFDDGRPKSGTREKSCSPQCGGKKVSFVE